MITSFLRTEAASLVARIYAPITRVRRKDEEYQVGGGPEARKPTSISQSRREQQRRGLHYAEAFIACHCIAKRSIGCRKVILPFFLFPSLFFPPYNREDGFFSLPTHQHQATTTHDKISEGRR